MTLRNNDTQNLRLSRKTIQRISFVLNLAGAGDVATVLLELINVKCILSRGGKEYVLFHENLQLLGMESNYYAGFSHAFKKEAITLSAGVKIVPIVVDLGTPVNLTGDDEINLEVTTKTNWYGTFDGTLSSIDVESREAIGVELAIPFIKTKAIQATLSRMVETFGDNVTSFMLLNTESNRTNSDADHVFESLIIISDKYNVSDNRGRMIARRVTQFETALAASDRGENFRYVPNVELDNLQVTLELNGVNVLSTKNYIVYRTFLPTKETGYRAQNMLNRHKSANIAKFQNQMS